LDHCVECNLSAYELARDYCNLLKHGVISPASFDARDAFPGDPDYDAYTAYIDDRAARDGLMVETWSHFHHVFHVVGSALLRPDGTQYEHDSQLMTGDWGHTIIRARRNARDRLRHAKARTERTPRDGA
jgi:hypothetical protein